VPQLALHHLRRNPWVLWLALGLLVLAVGAWLSGLAPSANRDEGRAVFDDDDLLLCRRYMRLKNDRDPSADRLLAPAPTVPSDPIAPAEVDGLDAAALLRSDITIRDVRPDTSNKDRHRYVVVTNGSAAGPLLHVRSGNKIDRLQRVMTNLSVVVEVRDGKIYPIRPTITTD